MVKKKRQGELFDRQALQLIVTVFIIGIALGFFFGRRSTELPQPARLVHKEVKEEIAKKQEEPERNVEVKPIVRPPERPVSVTPIPRQSFSIFSFFRKKATPKIAIVIDDIGNDVRHADLVWALPTQVTLAILPQLSKSGYYAIEGKKRGYTIILHQPLEPLHEYGDVDPGMIRTGMADEQILDILARDLADVPTAEGMNNHKGSKATQDLRVMNTILTELKARNLFFFDSMTSSTSVGWGKAKALHIPYAQRDVFLDNETEPDYIHAQIAGLASLARKNGSAIGIGHYKVNTLEVLKDEIKRLEDAGFDLVSVKELLK